MSSPKRQNATTTPKGAGTAVVPNIRGGHESSPSRFGRCMVVGVGASAGALEAFTQLLKALPKNPGMAFVLVPHLDPDHHSVMTELLARVTGMTVVQAQEGDAVQENTVYVIPPNRTMTISGGILRLSEREPRPTPSMPIDAFFRSLAQDCGQNAIGVILSGTASDGTAGIGAIKNEGGITFAQDRSAKYDSMPNSAISTGHVDFVLPPDKIAKELLRIRRHPYVTSMNGDDAAERVETPPASEMSQIFLILKQYRRVDFSDYKPATIRRRILRRMALAHVETLADYVRILKRNPLELEALHNDILINVTSFFRDSEAFEALQETVYPTIVRGRPPSDTIRIWVPGCSTGEEAYSHAISILEYVSRLRLEVSIQIFGTDLSDSAIRTARAGIYKESIAADVSPTRLRRFFRKVEGGYQISKSIRDMCVFATQNVFNDPPFSRMDLVSCRNVLIYLGPALQKRVFPIFHYALKPNGFLMVGNTEGIVGSGADLFEAADKRHRIYRKMMVASPVAFGIPPEHYDPRLPHPAAAPLTTVMRDTEPARTPIELQREADRLLLTKYVPAAVVVNDHLNILQTRGKASRYLELPSGKASLNLLKMAKPGLLFHLQTALDEAKQTAAPVRKEGLQLDLEGTLANINVEVIPFHAPLQESQSFVIVFEERNGQPAPPTVQLPETEDAKDKQILQLKQELAATKEYLQSIIEALEASNEELQSANEEIQSGNEELQSTNEELQTSKEELESANEELNTVNEEMQHRNLQLTQLNNDLENLLASVNIPILMLDADLSIRRITPQAEDVLGVSSADVGRPIRHIRMKLNVPELEATMLDVIEHLQPRELQLNGTQNHSYRVRITPYRTMDNRIEGVVLACIDVPTIARETAEQPAKQARKSRSRDKGK